MVIRFMNKYNQITTIIQTIEFYVYYYHGKSLPEIFLMYSAMSIFRIYHGPCILQKLRPCIMTTTITITTIMIVVNVKLGIISVLRKHDLFRLFHFKYLPIIYVSSFVPK